jgi:multidrug efflux pump subunit AcrA (membrane-fusion protein)
MSIVMRIAIGTTITLAAYLGMKTVPKYMLTAEAATPRPQAAPVATPVVETRRPAEPPPVEGWTGVLLSPSIELTSRSDTTMKQLNVRVGDSVMAGAVLAQLDTTHLRHQLAAAEASLRASRADAWQASVQLKQARDRQRRRDGFVTYGSAALPVVSDEEKADSRFDSAQASGRVSAATASAQERAASVEALRTSLEEATLRAPFDGVIATTFVERGGHVRAGQQVIRLVGRGALRVRFAHPDGARDVHIGTRVTLEWDDRRLVAEVDRIAPEVEPSSSTTFVEGTVNLENGVDRLALAGRIVTVRPVREGQGVVQ